MNKNQRAIVAIIFILVLIIAFFIYNKFIPKKDDLDYEQPSPEETVRIYFNSWSEKDYVNMYATISDGFKKIEPSAKNLAAFREYAESQNINIVDTVSIKERSNDGETAIVDYEVEFFLVSGEKLNLKDSFTLKYRKGDIIPGWKLIHPYGENVDVN